MTSPADELRTAAYRLRSLVTRGCFPWHPDVFTVLSIREPVAKWLEDAAQRYEAAVTAAVDVYHDDPEAAERFITTGPGAQPHALAVARTVNKTCECGDD